MIKKTVRLKIVTISVVSHWLLSKFKTICKTNSETLRIKRWTKIHHVNTDRVVILKPGKEDL